LPVDISVDGVLSEDILVLWAGMNYLNARAASTPTLRHLIYCGGAFTQAPFAFLGGHFLILNIGLSPCRGDPHRAGLRDRAFL
jgi:hypothetical protein